MGVRLYLKSLRLILEREEDRLGRKSFPELLLDDSMHKALLAICFEIVSRAHVQIRLPFPAIPKAFNVCHMEFFVMIFNFLNAFESKLNRSVRNHLVSLQNKLLEYGTPYAMPGTTCYVPRHARCYRAPCRCFCQRHVFCFVCGCILSGPDLVMWGARRVAVGLAPLGSLRRGRHGQDVEPGAHPLPS